MRAILVALMLLAGVARAEGERAGSFDYWVLSLSWSPDWCLAEGRGSAQCAPGAGFGWVLHGLWPQFQRGGYPSYCRTGARDPSRAATAAMADIMGTDGAAWYQWKKHGRCSGLDGAAYLSLARRAFAAVKVPPVFARLPDQVAVPASVVEQAFLAANPGMCRIW